MFSKSKEFADRLFFVLPAFLVFFIFAVYPFLSSIYYSFTEWNIVNKPVYIGFENYQRLFSDSSFIAATKNTFLFCFAGMLIGNPLSLLLALLLNRNMPGRGLLRAIFYLPSVLSMMVVSVIWSIILNYDGVINYFLKLLGLENHVTDWLSNITTVIPVIVIVGLWGIGCAAVIYLAGLQAIPIEIYESSLIDGVNTLNKFRYITLPLLMPSVTVVTFLSLVGNLKIFELPYIMTNGGPGDASLTLVMKVYNLAFKNNTYGYATAAGIVLFIFIIIVSSIQLAITRRKEVEL